MNDPQPAPSGVSAAAPAPRSRLERGLFVFAWVLIVGLYAWHAAIFPLMSPSADYDKHWHAAVAILDSRSPYLGEELYLGYNYPMLPGLAYVWLAAVDVRTGETLWELLNLVYSILGGVIIVWGMRPMVERRWGIDIVDKLAGVFRRYWITAVFLFLASYQPLHRVLIASNIEPLNLVLGSLFFACAARRHDKAAGVFLALFALVKLAPVLLLIPLVAMRRWRTVGVAMACFTMYGLFLLVTGYWRWEMYLYTHVVHVIAHHYIGISLSIHRFVATVFAPEIIDDAAAYRHLVTTLNIAMLLPYLAICAWWMRLRDRDPSLMLAFGAFMVLLFTPLLEVNHFVWVTGAMFLQLRAWLEGRVTPAAFAGLATGWSGIMAIEALRIIGMTYKFVYPFQIQTIVLLWMIAVSGWAAFARVPEPEKESAAA